MRKIVLLIVVTYIMTVIVVATNDENDNRLDLAGGVKRGGFKMQAVPSWKLRALGHVEA